MEHIETPTGGDGCSSGDIATDVGAMVRRFRRTRGMSQRTLARRLGWPQATLSRAESDASAMTLTRAEELLRHTGHRWAIVPVDPSPGPGGTRP